MPLGVAIPLRYPAAPGAWDEMMSYAADFGFTEAAVDVPWALWEPEEGKRDFAMVDAIMDAAEKHGIRAFPVAGPRFSMTRGRAPDNKTSLMGPPAWYMARHPESALRSAAGESVRGCDGMFWEFAFVDPRNLKKVPAYLATWGASLDALSKQAGGRKGLGGWFLSNEPLMGQGPNDIRNLKKAALLGYNPEYREAFRAWLKQKYGTMEALRAEWGAAAPSAIAEITPPSASEIRASETAPGRRYRGQYARIRDWLLFRASALAGGLRWEGDRLSAGVAVPAVPKLYPFAVNGRLDPDGYAPDVAGEAFAGPVAMDLAADAIPFPLHTRLQDVAIGAARASGRPIWLTDYCLKRAELLGGEDRQDLLSAPYAEPYIMGAVLAGARGFFFRSLQNVPAQSSFAYTGRKGTKNVTLSDEGLAVAKTTQSLKVMAPWLAGASLAPPRYGLLVQWDTLLNDDPEGDHALAVLNVLALAGVHEVAVVTEEQLVRGRAAEFEVILTPYATRISRKAVGVLEKFVRNGGVLISDTYIGSKQANGKPRGVLPFGLGELFGLRPEKEGQASDAGNVGVVQAPAFTQFTKLMPFSISLYSGSWRVRARAGTEVLANYLGGKDGREIPAITVRKHGRGSAVVFPRVRHWPEHLREMAGRRLPRPELRGLLMGRTGLMMNGVVCAITMRRLLNRLGVLPAARLVRAPVSPRFLAEMAAWAKDAGIPADEIAHSEKLIRESQTGFPILKRIELVTLQRFWEVDMDEFAPVRVNMLAGADGGRVAAAINYSSMARVAELALPPCGALVDCLTGEEFAVKDGRTSLELGPYQARLLALLER